MGRAPISTQAMPVQALVIGAGPAGLMAAEALSAAGLRVQVAEAKPSVARKFLMAGKSGLNLTRLTPDTPAQDGFLRAYGPAADDLRPMITALPPQAIRTWAEALGQPCFTGSTGRLFPKAMKASPLLRAWLARLHGQGVQIHTRWRWLGWDGITCQFDTPEGPKTIAPGVTVLALGGASWARLGSDGLWADTLRATGIVPTPFAPANAGLSVPWSDHMIRHFGAPLKSVRLTAGHLTSRGEIVVSTRGLEGGGLYPLTPALRDGARLCMDLRPDLNVADLAARLAKGGTRASLSNRLRRVGLGPAAIALAQECHHPLPRDAEALAQQIKALHLPHATLRPMDEAISTAGGIRWADLTRGLMLRARPGTFAAGEMLDWEAPTGGYLLNGCLATGLWAGRAAAQWYADHPPSNTPRSNTPRSNAPRRP